MKRTCEMSKASQNHLVLPADTNHIGTIFGGKILEYIDEVAAISAMKHANMTVVTASIDSVDFISAARIGDILHIEGFVTYTGRTSMEVYVKVCAENILAGTETITTESFLTMVAVEESGKPAAVPKVYPETDFEHELYNTAKERRIIRLRRAARHKNN